MKSDEEKLRSENWRFITLTNAMHQIIFWYHSKLVLRHSQGKNKSKVKQINYR
jgi:hypothetical protein